MTLKTHGKSTLPTVEILNISINGIWVYVDGKEYFLSHKDFPWFENATVKQIHNVEFSHGYHLYWPDLDVDLELKSIENPEQYPVVF